MRDFTEEKQREYSGEYEEVWLYTDGACRGNPGEGAVAYIIFGNKRKEIRRGCAQIGQTTNNRAEYLALIEGLGSAEKITNGVVHCFLDSELVVLQVTEKYQIKDDELRRLFERVLLKEACFKKVTYTHVPRTNPIIRKVDLLANSAFEGECEEHILEMKGND